MAQLIKGKQIASQTIVISGTTGNVIALGNLDLGVYEALMTNYPTTNNSLTNKAYVDAVAQGVSPHAPVRVVSTSNITLSGVSTVIDGATLVEGDSVLVAGQTDKRENGLWTVHTPGVWSRRADADGDPDNEVELGDFVFVSSGTTNGSSGWVLGDTDSSDMPIIPGVETQEWFKMAAPGSYSTDGQGLELSGSVFSLELADTSLTKSNSGLQIATGYTASVSIAVSQAISSEASSRVSVDESLASELSTETSDRISGDTSLTSALSAEASTRGSADTSLSTAISAGVTGLTSLSSAISLETSNRVSGDTSLTNAVSTEISDRISGDTSLTSALSSEASTRGSADTSLSTAISAGVTGITSLSSAISLETSNRVSGDTSLTSALSTEASTRGSDDTSLSTAISGETSLRVSGDLSLSTAISAMSGSTLDLSTIMGEGEVLGIVGGNLTGVSYSTITSGAISAEASTRTSADASLSTAISNSVTGLTSLSSAISLETSNRVSGDESLTTLISNETSTRASADTSLSTAISGETSSRVSADLSLQSAILAIDVPAIYSEIYAGVIGSTDSVVISAAAFPYGTGIVDVDSVLVFINGIEYRFAYTNVPGIVFHTGGVTPAGTGITLYFDATSTGANFSLEADDQIIVKYMVVT